MQSAMTPKNRLATAGAAIGAALLIAGLCQPAWAEQSDKPGRTRVDRVDTHRNAVRSASSQGRRDTQSKPWSIEDALPSNSPAARASQPAPKQSELGRMPLRSNGGSIGIETETKFKPNEFPDGKHTPGLDTSTKNPPQYLGLSLSVPTTDKSIIPSHLLPPWARQD
jgi:hypothetical protein